MIQTLQKQVTVIEANPLLAKASNEAKKLRVAAYCRVSTDADEQLNSYEAQIAYYTETIAKNPNWVFAGIYADEGITGTLTSKRKDFLRLMSDCDKGKIDMILTKSISRFARNTVDSLGWVRKLRSKNIGVYFEEQAIDSLKAENEMLIGFFSVIAQAESENISANVKWGIHQSMKNGKFCSNFTCFGYKRGENGVPEIVEEQAEIVRFIFDRYLDGYSLEQIQNSLKLKYAEVFNDKVPDKKTISRILANEKYAGDLLLQKTFCVDPISKKKKENKGELPKYLVSNNHPAIVEREKYQLVQMEIARRGSKHKKSEKTITQQGKYSGKFALSELLICGDCGSHFRRNGKTGKNGAHKYYWRCILRSEQGKNYCKSAGIEEEKLHLAICRSMNRFFAVKDEAINLLKSHLVYAISGSDSAADVYLLEKQILDLQKTSDEIMTMMSKSGGAAERFLAEIEKNYSKIKVLREQLSIAKANAENSPNLNAQLQEFENLLTQGNLSFEKYDDIIMRRLVECIRVENDKIVIILKGGLQTEEPLTLVA